MPKKVLIAMPPGMLEQADIIANIEHRTRSDLIRESIRQYIERFKIKRKQLETEAPVPIAV